MKKMRKVYLALCAAVLVFAWAGTSIANELLIDDVWLLTDGTLNDGDVSITVSALNDGGNDPGPGLQYNIVPSLTTTGIGDLFIGIMVTTLGNQLIKDNSLYLDDYSNFNISIREMITDTPIPEGTEPPIIQDIFNQQDSFPGTYLGFKEVYSLSDQAVQIYDSANFSPTDMIYLTTWIHLEVVNGVTPQLTQFTQRFSQTPVPEPATMLLLGTGLVGVAGAARRKKKNQA